MQILLSLYDLEVYKWEMPMPKLLSYIGVGFFIGGKAVYGVVKYKNVCFYDDIVVSKEHKLYTQGPYQVVRHPGYLAELICLGSTSLIYGSIYGLIPTLIGYALIVIKSCIEDKFLETNIEDYKNYQNEVIYRIFPYFI